MSESEHETSRALAKLQDDVDLLKKALLGDLSVNKDSRGLIANHLMMMDDLYRNGSGIKNRVERLENYKLQMAAWIAGASFVCGGVWLFIKDLIGKK